MASKVIDIMSRAVDPSVALREALREAGASEFIGLATDGPGRRPGGLGESKGKGKGSKGKPSVGKGKVQFADRCSIIMVVVVLMCYKPLYFNVQKWHHKDNAASFY